jgi:hypothetical protein
LKPLLEHILREEALKEMANKALTGHRLLIEKGTVLQIIKIELAPPPEGQPPKR